MDTFAHRLALSTITESFASCLATAAERTQVDHRLYPNEVEPATRLVRAIRCGARTILLAHPMQSGKTNIMRATTHILREMVPSTRAIYICANDQLDLRNDTRTALAPHVELLTRSQRRKIEHIAVDRPTIVFYDESHFGDGADMTIQQFLERHGLLDEPLAVFCGVSATPMTSMGCLDATVWGDMRALEAAGYNSPRLMLERGRIRQSTPMFEAPSRRDLGRAPTAEDVTVIGYNAALLALEDRLAQKRRYGYCIIRAHRWECEALRAYLEGRWRDRVYVVDWNQHNREFSPRAFFPQRNFGVVTVVLVQHKARMGTVIDTKECIFLYEHRKTRRGMTVDTIAQSFIGRACGFGKQDHDALVFTNPQVARAYTLLMGRMDGGTSFARFCEERKMRPATRARVAHGSPSYALGTLEMFEASAKDSTAKIRRRCENIRKAYALVQGMGAIRTFSRSANPLKAGLVDTHGRPRKAFAEARCGAAPGSWSMVIFDRTPGKGVPAGDGPGKGIILAVRGNERVAGTAIIEPSEDSMHFDLRARRRRQGQMSLAFSPAHVSLAAAAR